MMFMNPLWLLGGLLGGILLFILVVGFIMLIVRLIFWGTWRSHRRPIGRYYGREWRPRGEAFGILEARYARGEITKEQYLDMRKTLEEG